MANLLRVELYQMVAFVLFVLVFVVPKSAADIGLCYGLLGDNLPPPAEVVALCTQYNIQRLRLYNPNPQVLEALQGSGIEVILGVVNNDIPNIAASQENANQWVQQNVKAYSNVKFKYITVGNEINSIIALRESILPAMKNIYNSVNSLGIKVSTVFDLMILGNSYPPSAGSFNDEIMPFIKPIVDFLVTTNGPFCIDAYPYFAHASEPNNITLDYALGSATLPVIQDGPYAYLTLLDAMVDSTYSALEKIGGESLTIVVTETGWSSEGGIDTTLENAAIYNTKLVPHIVGGTPKRPEKSIETYIFAFFDENQKNPLVEQHWGLFLPNKEPKYPINFIV